MVDATPEDPRGVRVSVCLTRVLDTVSKLAVGPQDGARRGTARRQGPQMDASEASGGSSKHPGCTPGASQLGTSGGGTARLNARACHRLPGGTERSARPCRLLPRTERNPDPGAGPEAPVRAAVLATSLILGLLQGPRRAPRFLPRDASPPSGGSCLVVSGACVASGAVRCIFYYWSVSHSNNVSFYSWQERHRAVKTGVGQTGMRAGSKGGGKRTRHALVRESPPAARPGSRSPCCVPRTVGGV